MKLTKGKIIAAVAVIAVLAGAFWYGGNAPGLQGWTVQEQESSAVLEAAPPAEFSRYTGLEEAAIRPQLDAAIAQGYLQEDEQNWQITEHGKLFLNSLLELFLNE